MDEIMQDDWMDELIEDIVQSMDNIIQGLEW